MKIEKTERQIQKERIKTEASMRKDEEQLEINEKRCRCSRLKKKFLEDTLAAIHEGYFLFQQK